jgi:hypothetical protein
VKIVVCMKQVPATTAEKRYGADLRLERTASESIINPLDEYAIEQALRLADDGKVESVAYLSMGPEQASEALRRALAMGGDEAYLVTDEALAGADEWATARVLAAAPSIPVADGFGRTTAVNIGGSAIFLLVLPFIYGIFGWILTALGCLLYNLVAAVTGGIAVEVVREAPPAAAPALQGWGQPQP